jgi:hypothetical protein
MPYARRPSPACPARSSMRWRDQGAPTRAQRHGTGTSAVLALLRRILFRVRRNAPVQEVSGAHLQTTEPIQDHLSKEASVAPRENPAGAGEPPEGGEGRPRVEPAAPIRGPMRGAAFAVFFNDLAAIATDAARSETTPMELLQRSGLDVDLPPDLDRRLRPLLTASRASIGLRPGTVTASSCGACGACGACALCGQINYGVPGAAAAAIWGLALTTAQDGF